MKRGILVLSTVLSMATTVWTERVFAQSLTISRPSSSSTVVTYFGQSSNSCWAGPATHSVNVVGNAITIATTLSSSACFPTPPPGPPFSYAVSTGPLPDGTYLVSWSFNPAVYPSAAASLALSLSTGTLEIPALSLGALLLSAIGCLGIGLRFLSAGCSDGAP